MTKDGKYLEGLVAFVERTLLGKGFDVTMNRQVVDDAGVQIAEFDIEIRGKVGSTKFAWLIECRDRPGSGAAPGAWIEQLYGRRERFGFNKVTAVSTTGFARGAQEYAERIGIELREVRSLTPDAFADWLLVREYQSVTSMGTLSGAQFMLREDEPKERVDAVIEVLNRGAVPLLRSVRDGVLVEPQAAFAHAAKAANMFEGIEPNAAPQPVRFQVEYVNDDDHYVIETELGPVRVKSIVFDGTLSVKDEMVPLMGMSEYRGEDGKIAQSAVFKAQELVGAGAFDGIGRIDSSAICPLSSR